MIGRLDFCWVTMPLIINHSPNRKIDVLLKIASFNPLKVSSAHSKLHQVNSIPPWCEQGEYRQRLVSPAINNCVKNACITPGHGQSRPYIPPQRYTDVCSDLLCDMSVTYPPPFPPPHPHSGAASAPLEGVLSATSSAVGRFTLQLSDMSGYMYRFHLLARVLFT